MLLILCLCPVTDRTVQAQRGKSSIIEVSSLLHSHCPFSTWIPEECEANSHSGYNILHYPGLYGWHLSGITAYVTSPVELPTFPRCHAHAYFPGLPGVCPSLLSAVLHASYVHLYLVTPRNRIPPLNFLPRKSSYTLVCLPFQSSGDSVSS